MSLRVEYLQKRFTAPDGTTVPVIDVEQLELADAEQVALVGGSGTGKTTLLHLLAGILTPDRGQIIFSAGSGESRDTDIAKLDEAARDRFRGRHIGYIFQTHHLLGGFTAIENVLLGMSFTGRAHDRGWARRLLDEVGLSHRLDYLPEKLSVGQQQRVAVARALANRPSVVLADEPTGALDPSTAQTVLKLIQTLCSEIGASLLLVSHDPAVSSQFSRVVKLSDLNRASSAVAAAAAGA